MLLYCRVCEIPGSARNLPTPCAPCVPTWKDETFSVGRMHSPSAMPRRRRNRRESPGLGNYGNGKNILEINRTLISILHLVLHLVSRYCAIHIVFLKTLLFFRWIGNDTVVLFKGYEFVSKSCVRNRSGWADISGTGGIWMEYKLIWECASWDWLTHGIDWIMDIHGVDEH